jgi:hypothetical protein
MASDQVREQFRDSNRLQAGWDPDYSMHPQPRVMPFSMWPTMAKELNGVLTGTFPTAAPGGGTQPIAPGSATSRYAPASSYGASGGCAPASSFGAIVADDSARTIPPMMWGGEDWVQSIRDTEAVYGTQAGIVAASADDCAPHLLDAADRVRRSC